jgi:hypothetical protein
MPEPELELIEPLDGCRSELLELDELEVLVVEEPLEEAWPVEFLELDPGTVIASTTPKTPRAPIAASTTAAVSSLIRLVVRSRA